jgi:hypothetical protein
VTGDHPAVQQLAASGEPIVIRESKIPEPKQSSNGGNGGRKSYGGPRNGRAAQRTHRRPA